jgi:hypothetical protein
MSALPVSAARTRPAAITAAVVLSALVIIGNVASLALPSGSGDNQVPTFIIILGVILGIVGIPAAVGLWQLRKWGMILTVVVSALNLLSTAPGIAFGPNAGIRLFAGIGTLLPALIIVLVLLPDARRTYR